AASGFDASFSNLLARIKDPAHQGTLGTSVTRDPRVRQKLAQVKIDLTILQLIALDSLARLRDGRAPGPESSMGTVCKSELEQRLYDLSVELLGPYATLWQGPHAVDGGRWDWYMLWSRAATIYAGTNEIQRNIIAQRVLGLPRS